MRRFLAAAGGLALSAAALVLPAAPAHALDCTDTFPSQAQTYVCGLYEDVLQRVPSAREVGYWTDRVQRFPRRQTVEAFEFSVEVMVEVAGQGYVDILERESDPAGLGFWTDRLRTRAITPEGYLRALADSQEFDLKHPTSASVVTFWYDQIFDRAPDDDGLNFWVGRLDAGLKRSVLVSTLQNSDEAVAHAVDLAYQQVLQRSPSAGEVGTWAPVVRGFGSAQLVVELASSDEAFSSAT